MLRVGVGSTRDVLPRLSGARLDHPADPGDGEGVPRPYRRAASGQARRDPAPPARKEGADTPAERRAARARLQAEYRAARPAECAAANPAAELARAIDAIRS
jgi:hypothetical protein